MILRSTLGIALLVAVSAPAAHGAATVLGSRLGYDCALAALAGYSDQTSIDTCTLALESAGLSGRDRAGTYVNRGVIQLRRKAYRQAHADFDIALALEPQLGEAFVNRGAAYLDYQEALRLKPGWSEPERNLARFAVRLK